MAHLESERAKAALGSVKDPLFDKDLLSLAYLKDLTVDGTRANVILQLPTPAHPHRSAIEAAVKKAIGDVGATDVTVDFKWQVTERLSRPSGAGGGGAGGDRLPG